MRHPLPSQSLHLHLLKGATQPPGRAHAAPGAGLLGLTGTRESEQPIQRYSGFCWFTRRLKNSGSLSRISAAQCLRGGGRRAAEQYSDASSPNF